MIARALFFLSLFLGVGSAHADWSDSRPLEVGRVLRSIHGKPVHYSNYFSHSHKCETRSRTLERMGSRLGDLAGRADSLAANCDAKGETWAVNGDDAYIVLGRQDRILAQGKKTKDQTALVSPGGDYLAILDHKESSEESAKTYSRVVRLDTGEAVVDFQAGFSPDKFLPGDRFLAGRYHDGRRGFLDLRTGKFLEEEGRDLPLPLSSVLIPASGKVLGTSKDGLVKLWSPDLSAAEAIPGLPPGLPFATDDGSLLGTVSGPFVFVWKRESRSLVGFTVSRGDKNLLVRVAKDVDGVEIPEKLIDLRDLSAGDPKGHPRLERFRHLIPSSGSVYLVSARGAYPAQDGFRLAFDLTFPNGEKVSYVVALDGDLKPSAVRRIRSGLPKNIEFDQARNVLVGGDGKNDLFEIGLER